MNNENKKDEVYSLSTHFPPQTHRLSNLENLNPL